MNAAPVTIPPTTPRMAAALRRIGFLLARRALLRSRRRLLGRRRRLFGRRLPGGTLRGDRAQGALEVVEDESHGRIGSGRRRDPRRPIGNHEDAAFVRRGLELDQRVAAPDPDLLRLLEEAPGTGGQRPGAAFLQGCCGHLALIVEHDRGLDLRGDLGQIGESLLRVHRRYSIFRRVRVRRRDLWRKFFGDRGPHLAAMIAYFALLSFVPLTFLSLSLLGLAGRADESSFLVKEIKRALPGAPINRIVDLVHVVQDNAAALGIVGGAALIWTSLSLFSVLESAFNIVYGRPNRSFLRGKALAVTLMVGSLVTLFVALLAGSLGVAALQRYVPGFADSVVAAYVLSITVSLLGVFAFLISCYTFFSNSEVPARQALPGAALAAVLLEATFQVLPFYQRYANLNPTLRAFGSPAILLVWLYVMANVIVFGAELNWWRARRAEQTLVEELPGLA